MEGFSSMSRSLKDTSAKDIERRWRGLWRNKWRTDANMTRFSRDRRLHPRWEPVRVSGRHHEGRELQFELNQGLVRHGWQ